MPITTSFAPTSSTTRAPASASSSAPSTARRNAPSPPAIRPSTSAGIDAERRRQLGRIEHAQPPAGPRPDDDDPPATLDRIDDERRRARDRRGRRERRIDRNPMRPDEHARKRFIVEPVDVGGRRIEQLGIGQIVTQRRSRSASRSAPRAGSSPPLTIAAPGNIPVQTRLEQKRQQTVLPKQPAGQRDPRRRLEQLHGAQRGFHEIAQLLRRLLHDLRRSPVPFTRRTR